jgi:hypothetical protein
MKRCVSGLFLLLLTGSLIYGQSANGPLTVTGTVLAVQTATKAAKPAGKTPQAANDLDDEIPIRIQLQLQFKNHSSRPIILFRPMGFPGRKQLMFLKDWPVDESTEIEAVQYNPLDTWPKSKIADRNWWVSRKLKANEPDPNYFVVIEPGGYYECGEYFEIKNGFKIDGKMKRGEILRTRPKPEFPALRIKFDLSLKGTSEDPDPLDAAQRRWRPVGDFLLTSDGKYSVTSEPIVNVLP